MKRILVYKDLGQGMFDNLRTLWNEMEDQAPRGQKSHAWPHEIRMKKEDIDLFIKTFKAQPIFRNIPIKEL